MQTFHAASSRRTAPTVRTLLSAAILLVSAGVHAGWVDEDLDSIADPAARRGQRSSSAGPVSSVDLLVNLQAANRSMGASGFSIRESSLGTASNSFGRGQLVDPFAPARRGDYASPFGPALGSQSAQSAGLYGSSAIPAATSFANSFNTRVEPTSLYGGNVAAPVVDERAAVRRATLPVNYNTTPGAAEIFLRWMQENRELIFGAGLLVLLLLGLVTMSTGSQRR